jgi:hypothetical protein
MFVFANKMFTSKKVDKSLNQFKINMIKSLQQSLNSIN